MKKNILSILLFMMVWGLLSSMQAKSQDNTNKLREYKIVSKTYFTTPLLTKVFPCINFYKANFGYPGSMEIYFDIDSLEYRAMNCYNFMIKKCNSTKIATTEEIIEAIVRLDFYRGDSSDYKINITKELHNNPSDKSDTLIYNYKANLINISFQKGINLFFLFDGNKFIHSCNSSDEIFLHIDQSYYENEKKTDVSVCVLGGSISKIENDGRYHFYATVQSCNKGAEKSKVTFEIKNLEENAGELIKMRIVYHETNTLLFPEITNIIVNNSHIAYVEDFELTDPLKTAICDIRIYHKVGGVAQWDVAKGHFQNEPLRDMVFVPENILNTTFSGGLGYNCRIYYCNDFFKNHPLGINHAWDFAVFVEQAMNNIWDKEVMEWQLSDGVPPDDDNMYEVAINSYFANPLNVTYHNTDETASITTVTSSDKIQRIGIGSRIKERFPEYNDELFLTRTILCHEFFHGIHTGFFLNGLTKNSFIYEGIPRFIQTVFMEPYGNYEFNGWGRMYQNDSWDFLTNNLNKNLTINNPERYDYCMFWRFLFENYKSGTPAQKLQVIKEICKSSETVTSVAEVVAMLNTKLGAGSGTFANFTFAYQDFAKRVLFNNCNYNTWNPCPSNSFYYDVPATEQTYSGSPITVTSPTLESFGVKYYHYTFTTAGRVYLQFDCDPNNNGNHADYYVNVLVDKSSGLPANNPLTITTSNGEGGIFVDVTNPNDKIWVIVLRTDTKTGQTENYTLSMGASNNALYNFSADKTVVTGDKGMVTFTTSGNPIGYHWSFPGGNPSTSTSASPSVSYSTPGTYDVTLNDLTKTNYILVTSSNQNQYLNISAGYFPSYPYTKYDFYCSIIEGNPPYNYHFDFGDGCTNSITNSYEDYVNISHTYPASGIYYPSVTVYDNNYEYQTENLEAIAVNDPNSQIHADFSFSPSDYGTGPRHFTSTTIGGAVPYLQFEWTFGEDPVTHLSPVCPGGYNWATYYNFNHDPNFNGNPTFNPNYTNYGTFPVTLKVTDYNGAYSTITKMIYITEPIRCRPVSINYACSRIGMNSYKYFEPFLLAPQCNGCYDWTSTDCCHSLSHPPYDGYEFCNQNLAHWKLYKYPDYNTIIDHLDPITESTNMNQLGFQHYFESEGTYILKLSMSDTHQECRPAGTNRTCDYTTSISFDVVDCDKITTICTEPQLPEKLDVGGNIYVGLSNSCNNYTLQGNLDYFYAATKSIYLGKGYFSPGVGKKFFAQIKDCYISSDFFNKSDVSTKNNESINYSSLKETVADNKTKSFDISTLKMEVIPNPSEGKFIVSINGIMDADFFNEYHVDLKIYSMIGSLVYNNKLIKEAKTNVDFTQQLPGIYMMKLMINDKILTQKVVLQ